MRIRLIVGDSLSNYALGVISRNPQIKLEDIRNSERMDSYPFEVLTSESSENDPPCDALVIVSEDIGQIFNITSKAVSEGRCSDKIKIIIVRPSCISANVDFMVDNKFAADRVIELPFADTAKKLLSESLHSVVSPNDIANEIYTTQDNIEAYRFEKLYVNIFMLKNDGTIACTYTEDGTILNSCINGRTGFGKKIQELCIPIPDDMESVVRIDNVCPIIRLWHKNYFHFMTEMLDKILIAEELGFTGRYMLYQDGDSKALMSIIGIPEDRILWIEPDDIGKTYLITNAFDVQGFGIRTCKTIMRLIGKCRGIAEALTSNNDMQYPRLLYIVRKGKRKLLGIEKIIEKYGFYTFYPEEHSLEDEIKYFHSADIILCPHGAALANSFYMKEGAALVETCPCNWSEGSAASIIIAKHNNTLYRQIVEPTNLNPTAKDGQFRDYHVNNMLLEITIDELLKRFENKTT